MRSPTVSASCFLAVAAATSILLPATPSRATLLEQPPKLYTFRLDDPAVAHLDLLRSFLDAEIERPGPFRRYVSGRFGRWNDKPWMPLQWRPMRSMSEEIDVPSATSEGEHGSAHIVGESWPIGFFMGTSAEPLRMIPEVPIAWAAMEANDPLPFLTTTGSTLKSNGYDSLWAPKSKPVVDWRCRRRPVRFVRGTGEQDVFPLVRCDGSVAPEALDRLSLMMRPPHVERPTGLLPDEPDPDAASHGEWVADVRLAHPRLLWAIQRLADAFPWRAIYVYSGYRPGALVAGTSHHSLHSAARAVDIQIQGVSNTQVFEVCRKLDDVGCGFYPNSKFVHVDVRRPGTGHAVWIDASGPGEPPRYVDAWPGVLAQGGGFIWGPKRNARSAPDGDPLSCVSGGVSTPSCIVAPPAP
ncbi:MAG TPA: D-Ala-D-Ala carboxypeptidase family metallohydrolase [Polyangium sp.]|nr:D-Ala-D-Ala carboxypeptidase family metallohydrolase [Polyangium sp.]